MERELLKKKYSGRSWIKRVYKTPYGNTVDVVDEENDRVLCKLETLIALFGTKKTIF